MPPTRHSAAAGYRARFSKSGVIRRESAKISKNTVNVPKELAIHALPGSTSDCTPITLPKNVIECRKDHWALMPTSASRMPMA